MLVLHIPDGMLPDSASDAMVFEGLLVNRMALGKL